MSQQLVVEELHFVTFKFDGSYTYVIDQSMSYIYVIDQSMDYRKKVCNRQYNKDAVKYIACHTRGGLEMRDACASAMTYIIFVVV